MNPFKEESADQYPLNTKEEADSCLNKTSEYDKETMKQLAPVGQKQYEKFVKDIADTQMPSSLTESVKKNMPSLFMLKAKSNQ